MQSKTGDGDSSHEMPDTKDESPNQAELLENGGMPKWRKSNMDVLNSRHVKVRNGIRNPGLVKSDIDKAKPH